MFVNCPYCGFLVALDDTGQPLVRCPNCAQRLREDAPAPVAPEPAHAEQPAPSASETEHAEQPLSPVETPAASIAAPEAPPAADSAHGDATEVQLQAHLDQEETQASEIAVPAAPTEPTGDAQPADEAEPRDEALPPPVTIDETTLDRIATVDPFVSGIAEIEMAAAPDRAPAAEIEAAPDTEAETEAALSLASADAQPHGDDPLETDHEAHSTSAAEADPAAQAPAPADAASVEPSLLGSAWQKPPSKLGPTGSESPRAAGDGSEELHESADASAPTAQPTQPAVDAEVAPAETVSSTPTEAATVAPAPAAARVRKSPPAPSFARSKPQALPVDRRRLALHWGAIAALSLLLALQLLLSDRARLAGDPRWRPLLAPLCAMLQCTLPPWREPQAFRVVERDVRARQPGVLRVSARIRNDARWPQPWPVLQLTLSDANGREVATRVFVPREYLGGAPSQSQLESGQSAALAMDIVEPGPQAVAFTFDFK